MSKKTNVEGLNAQGYRRTDGWCRFEEGCYLSRWHESDDDVPGGGRRERPNAINNDDRADREGNTDAQCHDDRVGLRVAAGLEPLIPTVEQLRDRRAEADGKNRRNGESSHHCRECSMRASSAPLRSARRCN